MLDWLLRRLIDKLNAVEKKLDIIIELLRKRRPNRLVIKLGSPRKQ